MYQKDYILKMIEMLAKFVAAILSRISKGKYQEAEDLIEESYLTLLKESASKFTFIPKEKLTDRLLAEHHFVNGHLEILAQLFKLEAALRMAQGNRTQAVDLYEKALILFNFLDTHSKEFSIQRNSDMSEIKNRLLELCASC